MSDRKNLTSNDCNNGIDIKTITIENSLINIRCLSRKRTRFEVEYGLEKGSSSNSFLFLPDKQKEENHAILIHPPSITYAKVFLEELRQNLPAQPQKLSIIIGHINPKRIQLLKEIGANYPNIEIICSNPGGKLLRELWKQKPPSNKNEDQERLLNKLPRITVIQNEKSLDIGNNYCLKLIPTPTARWPGGLIAFEQKQGLLMSDKLFGAHICTEKWAEATRDSTEEERRYYFDCLMAPMTSQIDAIIERINELDICTIAPGHGPAIEISWRSLLNDYRKWGEGQQIVAIKVVLLFASAYGNTAAIADALAKGINKTGVRVESLNCEFTQANELTEAIEQADAYLIGSPTLGGHAPTPIISALGVLLAEGKREKPVGVFGSFGWSGEALDLLEKKLSDGGFLFGFEPIKIKFSPDLVMLKTIEETGTSFGRKLLKSHKRNQRRITSDISSSRSEPSLLALGRIVGSLCVLTTQKGEDLDALNGAMIASWISQASFSPPGLSIAVAKDRAVENLLHIGDYFALNVLAMGKEKALMKTFLKPFSPGANRLDGLELGKSPNNQPLLKESLAWMECNIKKRMECGDHWVIYAEVKYGKVLDKEGITAVHHRRSGSTY